MYASEELATFVQETNDLVETLEQGLLGLEVVQDRDTIHALFRAAHTIKGNAGIVGASTCVHFTHMMESVFAKMRDGVLEPSTEVVGILLESVDALRAMTAAIAAGTTDPGLEGRTHLLEALEEMTGAEGHCELGASSPDVERTLRIVLGVPETEPAATLAGLVDEIAALGEVLSIEPARGTPEAREFRFDLRARMRPADVEGLVMFSAASIAIETIETAAAPERVAEEDGSSASEPAAAPASGPAVRPTAEEAGPQAKAAKKAGAVVKVESERLDLLLDLAGELTIALGAMRRATEDRSLPHRARLEALEALDRLGADVHERVMSLRMVQVRDTFERMRRPVRDAAQQLGKEVTVEVAGVETELDRKLLEDLTDPLTHMVRNAVAHGIESPEARTAAGKARGGRLLLRAMHRDGAAIIEVADDGAGIDAAKVRKRAIERGLVAEGATLTEPQTYALLFAPGFSTAEAVNNIAGRGVGLDVVVKSVERLRGRVEIRSAPGKGTTFRIRLPLTLAVVEGMNVRVGKETLSIPLGEVEGLLDPVDTEVHTLEGKMEYVDVRGELVPLVRLGGLLGLAAAGSAGAGPTNVVVVKSERRRFGLAVDGVVGMARTVVKSLDRSYELCGSAGTGAKRGRGLGGATILDDGRVGYVLDVHGVDALAFG